MARESEKMPARGVETREEKEATKQYIRGGGVSVLDGDIPFPGLFLPFLSFLSFAFFCNASRSFSFSSSACRMASASCSV